mgnify:FL=1
MPQEHDKIEQEIEQYDMGDLARLKAFAKSAFLPRSGMKTGADLAHDRGVQDRPLSWRHGSHRDHAHDSSRCGPAYAPPSQPSQSLEPRQIPSPVRFRFPFLGALLN